MLVKIGWKKDFVEKSTPVVPISAWMGDNILNKSDSMPWWKGTDVLVGSEVIHVDTVYDCLDKTCHPPQLMSPLSAPMRLPISSIHKVRGAGHVLVGRVEQGILECGEEVIFLPRHTPSNPCAGKVVTVEMHTPETCEAQRPIQVWRHHLERLVQDVGPGTNRRVDFCTSGDDVGLRIEGLAKDNMPRSGDIMVSKKDATLGQIIEFDAHIQVLDIPMRSWLVILLSVLCLRSVCLPHLEVEMEDGQGDWW